MNKKCFRANGKLLLTAEYLVLDHAKAIALPTKLGQTLEVEMLKDQFIIWESFLPQQQKWNSATFKISSQTIEIESEKNEFSLQLQQILQVLLDAKPILFREKGYHFTTHLEFDKNWGLGSSSTLIYNLATWANINPYLLLEKTFGGSGYDIACAGIDQPIFYQRNGIQPKIEVTEFRPNFSDQLFFVYLNQKKNSREAIKHYQQLDARTKQEAITKINRISEEVLSPVLALSEFENLITQHEIILSEVLELPTIKQQLFSDYPKAIKSLGAWGGDFILATGNQEQQSYFIKKGYHTVIPFKEMILL
ncbi:GYDIA family GHMP kinase [Mesonia sp. K7]|uniref:GYDIA family GHMP kinase n=1 Tax=Mesonia sp. K7 TaxID=2218606 RepID=UPI000DA7540D|nr:GYDIA family GHMP kinase [Mesonia sp. K7]PZD77774.1 GHMP kinase [Mesonia sp. K7]